MQQSCKQLFILLLCVIIAIDSTVDGVRLRATSLRIRTDSDKTVGKIKNSFTSNKYGTLGPSSHAPLQMAQMGKKNEL